MRTQVMTWISAILGIAVALNDPSLLNLVPGKYAHLISVIAAIAAIIGAALGRSLLAPTNSPRFANDAEPRPGQAAKFILIPLLLLGVPAARAQCGKERWAVKTGTDANASKVTLAPVSATIAQLVAIPYPKTKPGITRLKPTEYATVTVKADLVLYKHETDSDFHLVIQDKAGNHMIVEIPDPNCVGAKSPWLDKIATVRQAFLDHFGAPPKPAGKMTKTVKGKWPVTLTGVVFLDFKHGQTGVAPNGVELHPVLGLAFN
jgi:hypothetical protein